MPSSGAWARTFLGAPPEVVQVVLSGVTTYAMAGINVGWCQRFMARDTRDVKSIYVNWATVAVAGTVTLTIETIDATTGKPTGTLYDANATLAFTPVAGWQVLTFATLPTTGLVAGTEYAIVLLTTGVGTTQTLNSLISVSAITAWPEGVLTAAVGTVRSNFAEVAGGLGIATIVFEDNSEEADGMVPFAAGTAFAVYGTRAWGMQLVLKATITVRGVTSDAYARNGTPGDLRCRILDSTSTLVTSASVTADKDSLSTSSPNRRTRFYFPAVVTLAPGTYYVIFDQTDTTTTSGNNYSFRSATCRTAALCPSATTEVTTTDVTIGSPVWTNNTTQWPAIELMLDDIPAKMLYAGQGMDGS